MAFEINDHLNALARQPNPTVRSGKQEECPCQPEQEEEKEEGRHIRDLEGKRVANLAAKPFIQLARGKTYKSLTS